MFKRLWILALLCAVAVHAVAAPKDKVDVTLDAPLNNASFTAPAVIALAATASSKQSNHPVVQVRFFQGTTLLGTATQAPYTLNWSNVTAGNYTITATATDDKGNSTTSTAVSINVNAPPTVSLTAPTNNTNVTAPADVTLTANAADSDGSIVKVEFFNGTTLLGTATNAPYSINLVNVVSGNYTITAKATDNQGAAAISAPINLNINALPTVGITAPVNNAVYAAPAAVTLMATAADGDGTVSKVEFFNGTMLLGTATVAPYSLTLHGVAAGNYSLTAKATDNLGGVSASTAISIVVDVPPTVAITLPANNAVYAAPANITLTATATDSDGTVSKVEFFNGTTSLGVSPSAASPYSLVLNGVAASSYSITAKATDNLGIVTTSAPIAVTVNALPTVSLTTPANNATFIAPAAITLKANAGDSDGTISQVTFYNGGNFLGSTNTSPYTLNWPNVAAGTYSVTVAATDNLGGTATSTPVAFTVINNSAPTVTLTITPASAIGPATITLTANVADSDGSVASVEFYNGNLQLASIAQAPFSYSWQGVAVGNYSLTAKAIDNLGAATISAPATVSVRGATATVYYIQTDQLNTPRVITDANNNVVWKWDNSNPFGSNVPTASAGFEFNLRFPGQYFDKETNLHYNYLRDYDPSIGRYLESDPIGLAGGINTYSYVGGNPIRYVDPLGLAYQCRTGLGALGGADVGSMHHEYICFTDSTGKEVCRGYGRDDSNDSIWKKIKGVVNTVPSKILKDDENVTNGKATCEPDDKNDCMNKCMERKWKDLENKAPQYGWLAGLDCQDVSRTLWNDCTKLCTPKSK